MEPKLRLEIEEATGINLGRILIPPEAVVEAFRDLDAGQAFRFAYGFPAREMSKMVHVKVSKRRFVVGVKTFTTGPGTSVVRV